MGVSGTWRPVVEGRFFGDAAEVVRRCVVPGEGLVGRALVVNMGIMGVLGWKYRREGARSSRWEDVDENG